MNNDGCITLREYGRNNRCHAKRSAASNISTISIQTTQDTGVWDSKQSFFSSSSDSLAHCITYAHWLPVKQRIDNHLFTYITVTNQRPWLYFPSHFLYRRDHLFHWFFSFQMTEHLSLLLPFPLICPQPWNSLLPNIRISLPSYQYSIDRS